MNVEQFLAGGHDTLEFIAQYHESLISGERPVLFDVQPGYLRKALPAEAPENGETYESVLADVEKYILPGMTHWQSPNFFAFFPAQATYPSILSDMIINAINSIGFSWLASPAMTELEAITMDWLGKMLNLPESFLYYDKDGVLTGGGGVLEGTASEATSFVVLAARQRALAKLKEAHPEQDDHVLSSKLVAYTSDQAHFGVGRACFIGMIKLRSITSDEYGCMRGAALEKAIKEDVANGLHPAFVCATLGTTSTCAFDNLEEIGVVAREAGVWLHVDSAYAGSMFVCPEYRHWMRGLEHADSFNFNLHKNLAVGFDCSALWLQSQKDFIKAFSHEPSAYMTSEQLCPELMADYRFFQIALGRRFRSLKVWFVLRCYGVEGLQKMIRQCCRFAEKFVSHVKSSDKFELVEHAPSHFGLVCFRLKGSDEENSELLKRITATRRLFIISTRFGGQLVLRFAAGSALCKEEDIERAWQTILECAEQKQVEPEQA